MPSSRETPSPDLIARLLDQQGAALALYASQWTAAPDDCVQEALVELARQTHTPDSPVAWLYRVVKRRALNAARGENRRRAREEEAARRRLAATPGDPFTADSTEIAELINRVDGARREALVLRLWGGLSFAEIAAAAGVSTATAHRRYESAIEELRGAWDAPSATKGDR